MINRREVLKYPLALFCQGLPMSFKRLLCTVLLLFPSLPELARRSADPLVPEMPTQTRRQTSGLNSIAVFGRKAALDFFGE